MQKDITWHGLAWKSEEHCEIEASDAGIEARGSVYGTTEDGTDFEIGYVIELSPEWEVQHVLVNDAKHEGSSLDLQRENDQWFDAEGMHLEEFDRVEYIDLALTPLTNTLPIKRLPFTNNETHKISVLYVDLPKLELRKVEQCYTKLGKNTYRYQDIEILDFTADIVVDDDGLVVVYPNLFTSVVSVE